MSSIGQALGGIVGGAIGFMVGGPSLALKGAQLGIMAGGFLDPPKGPVINGPRLDDLSVQTSTYGAFIPRNYGTVAQNGNVFWLMNDRLTEVKTTTTSGGKGGPTQTTNTFSYYASFAVGLCQGPIDGVRRIWIGSDLFYDAGSNDLASIIASNQNAGKFTLYTGTDTQAASPLIQADKGAANVPAYRGLAYIVFDTLPLENYGNSLAGAQVKVEVVKSGAVVDSYTSFSFTQAAWGGIAYDGNVYVIVEDGGTKAAYTYDLTTWHNATIGTGNWQKVAYGRGKFCTISATGSTGNCGLSFDGGKTWTNSAMPNPNAWISIAWNGMVFCAIANNNAYGGGQVCTSPDGYTWTLTNTIANTTWQEIIWNGTIFCAISNGTATATSPDGVTWTAGTIPTGDWRSLAWDGAQFCAVANNRATGAVSPDGLTWTVGNSMLGLTGWISVAHNGSYFLALNNSSQDHAAKSLDGINWTLFTVAQKNWIEVIHGDGLLVGVSRSLAASNGLYIYSTLGVNAAQLSDVVEAECLESNLLQSADLDVTELTDMVRGYRVSSAGAIRGAIDPLRAAWPFDVVQHGYKIKFKARGSASVASIPAGDLDARAYGDSSGVRITDSREMDIVVPRKVTVQYLDTVREYDINSQYAERINTDAVNERSIDLPIVLTASEAAKKAEMLLYMYWLERYDISFVLPSAYAQIEPGDTITVQSDLASYELRVTSTNTIPDGRIECRAKYNSAAVYTPTAQGEEGQSVGAALALNGPSLFKLLDIPMMRDDDDTAGFPVAMTGYLNGWPGGILYRSDDSGQTWTDLVGFVSPGSVIGYATGSLGSHIGTSIDFSSSLAVRIYSGSLSSVTQQQMFSGQNWFAYGADGRWEIIAAQNAVLQGDGSYVMSDFLRGQRGTEWATGLHAAGDTIVLLDQSALAFVSVNSSSIGMNRAYRGITVGKALDSDSDMTFSYDAVNLECLSPCHITGSRNPSSNTWTLEWTRRSRYGDWRDYVDAPLGEASESYEVDIFSDGTYTTLKRTLTSSTQMVDYSSANQVTDFGSNQSTLYLKVYQLSASVGRGYPLTASITR